MSAPHYLVIDTETSGLFDWSKPADAPGQPRLAELAMIWLDAECNELTAESHFIKPDGWALAPDAAAANGLTIERLETEGIPVAEALNRYESAIKDGLIIVAFNAQFDTKVMRAELRRAGRADLFEQTPNICTMKALRGYVIKEATGKRGQPKLSDAAKHFKITHGALHSAMEDARVCAELLRWMQKLKIVPMPKVFYAKNRPQMPLREALEKSAVPYPHPGITGTEIVEHRTRMLRAMLRPTADEDF